MTASDKAKLQTIMNKVAALQASKSVSAEEYAVLCSVASKLNELGAEF